MAEQTSPNTESLPKELERQARRINEQLNGLKDANGGVTGLGLNGIIKETNESLTEMSAIVKKLSPELSKEFDLLKESLEDYKDRTNKIYGEVADSLLAYAMNLITNLDELKTSISTISKSIDNL